ncbi:large ribosomal subunit protein uL23m-like [Amphiura filiformis]|uniref:large ribosomal subunit protein uL23m-like n=1 Tax=Amphiura filiformis TaxID=82378 RepID=UPI003B21D12D
MAHLGRTFRPMHRYPVTVRGGPQRRNFFPEFWMRLVKSAVDNPPNIVTFHCPVQMTKFEIKSYLEKIYNVPVLKVNTEVVAIPLFRTHKNQRFKPKDDYKRAHITLPAGQTFEFPDLFPTTKKEEDDKTMQNLEKLQKKQDRIVKDRGGISPWFSL